MVIHPHKTQSRVLALRQKRQFKPLKLNATLGKNPVEQVGEHRVLSVVIDDELKWQPQLETYFCLTISNTTWTVTPVKYFSTRICSHT